MRLLYITQALDLDDPTLSVYHRWSQAVFATAESVHVVCLYEGRHALPSHVQVHSLGKEQGVGRLRYVLRFYTYVYRYRKEYDAVFVHMNQEYILLAGFIWKLLGKRVYFWRNHYAGSLLTDVAATFCTKIFCTSKHSYTARYRKTVLMPVGIDTASFTHENSAARAPRSLLFLSRMSPSKRPEMFIDALGRVLEQGISFRASLVGDPKKEDAAYYESLKSRAEYLGLHDRLEFHPGVPNASVPSWYARHDIFVNCSPSGMFDKTLFEAAASGCRVITTSEDFKDAAGEEAYAHDAEALAARIIATLSEDEDATERSRVKMRALARQESLATLTDRLLVECA